jgi:hypothetical protein
MYLTWHEISRQLSHYTYNIIEGKITSFWLDDNVWSAFFFIDARDDYLNARRLLYL